MIKLKKEKKNLVHCFDRIMGNACNVLPWGPWFLFTVLYCVFCKWKSIGLRLFKAFSRCWMQTFPPEGKKFLPFHQGRGMKLTSQHKHEHLPWSLTKMLVVRNVQTWYTKLLKINRKINRWKIIFQLNIW